MYSFIFVKTTGDAVIPVWHLFLFSLVQFKDLGDIGLKSYDLFSNPRSESINLSASLVDTD